MSLSSQLLHDVLVDNQHKKGENGGDGSETKPVTLPLSLLSRMTFVRTLRSSPKEKKIVLQVDYAGQPGVIVLEKTSFPADLSKDLVQSFE